jgi:ribosomal protein L11 methyltransferase
LAIDNDEWCIENGTENIQLNNVQKNVEIKLSEIKDVEENDFDIIIANIQKNILMDIADEIKKRVKKSGLILLSGLLLTDEDDIKTKYEKIGLKFLHKEIMDEWIALVLKKKPVFIKFECDIILKHLNEQSLPLLTFHPFR